MIYSCSNIRGLLVLNPNRGLLGSSTPVLNYLPLLAQTQHNHWHSTLTKLLVWVERLPRSKVRHDKSARGVKEDGTLTSRLLQPRRRIFISEPRVRNTAAKEAG